MNARLLLRLNMIKATRDLAGPQGVKVFQTEIELLVREQQPASGTNGKPAGIAAERKAYFGDLHVHTANSLDAFSYGHTGYALRCLSLCEG